MLKSVWALAGDGVAMLRQEGKKGNVNPSRRGHIEGVTGDIWEEVAFVSWSFKQHSDQECYNNNLPNWSAVNSRQMFKLVSCVCVFCCNSNWNRSRFNGAIEYIFYTCYICFGLKLNRERGISDLYWLIPIFENLMISGHIFHWLFIHWRFLTQPADNRM